jgi:hypothetical protein
MKTKSSAICSKLPNPILNSNLAKTLLSQVKIFLLCNLFYFVAMASLEAQPVKASAKLAPAATTGYVTGTCFVALPDSTSWSYISVELSDRINETILFYHEYAFDQSNSLPAGISWVRQGLDVTLGIGTLPKKLGWVGKVKLKNNSGVWSPPMEFLFQ